MEIHLAVSVCQPRTEDIKHLIENGRVRGRERVCVCEREVEEGEREREKEEKDKLSRCALDSASNNNIKDENVLHHPQVIHNQSYLV